MVKISYPASKEIKNHRADKAKQKRAVKEQFI